jgi:hypothetical protein
MKYQDALLLAIDKWNEDPISDEWLFENFRQDFVKVMSTADAFDSIDQTVDLLLQQTDESTAIEVLQTIIALAEQSGTTEIPPNLLSQKPQIIGQFSSFGEYAKNKLREILRYYRIDD